MSINVTRTVEIDAPPEVVWRVWSDVERWPEWTAGVAEVQVLPEGEGKTLAPGRKVRISQPRFPTALWLVTSVDPGRKWEWVSSSPGARITGRHEVEPTADGRSIAKMSLEYEGFVANLVARLSRSLTNHYIDLEAAGLKRESEARRSG